jgi:glycosyltransferase involved in cell wall biosynthesis
MAAGNVSIVQYWAGCPKSPNSKWHRFLEVVRKCRREGWHNYLVWSKMPDNPVLYEPFQREGCEIILQPRSRGNFDLGSIWRTYKLMRRLKCDVFHCYNDHTSPLIGAALAGVHARIWSKLSMSSYYEENKKPRGLHHLMPSTRISCFCAHRILVISNKVGRELLETAGFGKKIDTVYEPVEYQRFSDIDNENIQEEIIESSEFRTKIDTVYTPINYEHFANASENGKRAKLGYKSSHIMITSVGHAVPVKGWDIAIKAFALVHQQNPSARLILVGDSTSLEFYNQLIGQIKQYKMEDFVRFTGKRDDIPEILKASDIFILPSRSEGMPAALIEAMASGLPCAAANVGGVPELITDGENGLLFERENSTELAQKILILIQDKSLRKKLESQASIHTGKFDMNLYVDKLFNTYKSLLEIKRDNRCLVSLE